jgi:predicted NBD/HSP70 family sugar kinase
MRGGEGSGLRAYNERLIVSAIRVGGPMSKSDIARATGLSAQAARVIVDGLIKGAILCKLDKVRGQIGQPSTPIALNPGGAYAIGAKIGRRRLEVLSVDMCGDVLRRSVRHHDAPLPEPTLDALRDMILELLGDMTPAARKRVAGLGIAMPGDLHEWQAEIGVPDGALAGWRDIDPAARLGAATGLRATLINDAAAACAAEMIAGDALAGEDTVYFYVGAFVGGGVVLGGRVLRGAQMNAGALGSMPMTETDAQGRPAQLLDLASALQLERLLDAAGVGGPECLSQAPSAAGDAAFDAWAAVAAPALARAAVAAMSVIDFKSVVIDGVLSARWRRALTERVAQEVTRFNHAGLRAASVREGSVGPTAQVLGAALLPLHERFSPDADLIAPARLDHGAAQAHAATPALSTSPGRAKLS